MATWPTSLPDPQFSGYDLETTDATVRTSMDGGAPRVRRRNTATPDHVTLRFVLSEAQMATFRAFWDGGFMSGAAWVFMPVKTGRAAGLASRECRPLNGVFHAVPISKTHWSVDLKVEVRNA